MQPWRVRKPRGGNMPTRINRAQSSRDDGNRQSRQAHDEPGSSTPGVHRIGSTQRDPPTATHRRAAARHGDPSSDPSTASVSIQCNANARRAAYAARLSVGWSSRSRAANTAGNGVRRRNNHSNRGNRDGVRRSDNYSNTGDCYRRTNYAIRCNKDVGEVNAINSMPAAKLFHVLRRSAVHLLRLRRRFNLP